jgi:penicillin-binding protein A
VNRQIRRVAAAVGVLMLALLVNLNFVQVVKSDSYRENPNNRRVILTEYSTPRGQIVVQGRNIADSVITPDELKYLRKYPEGPVYAPLTGFYSLIYGKNGLEDTEDAVLEGTDNRVFGSRIADILTGRDPKGGSVLLTINDAAQQAAYKAMAKQKGAVVAIDPSTGAILAAVSLPSYDPNLLSSHDQTAITAYWNSLDPSSSESPLANRAFQQNYPPGSVFKVIVSAAALKAGVKPTDQIPAPTTLVLPDTNGHTLQNFNGESCGNGKTDTFANALAISCNTAFAQLGLTLGQDAVEQEAALFGLDGTQRSVPLNVAASRVGQIASLGDLAHASIGQQNVRITPLQGAMIAAAVANHGTLFMPYLVAQERAPDLSVISQDDGKNQLSQVLDSDPDDLLVQMMVGVVQTGTGTAAQIKDIPGVVVGGKTGTADTGVFDAKGNQTPPHAWFTGFADKNGVAKIAVAVLVENGGVNGNETTGGIAAAPVAKAVMEAYLKSAAGN